MIEEENFQQFFAMAVEEQVGPFQIVVLVLGRRR
jgi:hypothetical protein